MRNLKPFLLGALALGILAYAGAAAMAVAAQAAGRSLSLGMGSLVVVSVGSEKSTAVITFGSGLLVIAIAGGLANVGAAWLIRRRAEGRRHGVD